MSTLKNIKPLLLIFAFFLIGQQVQATTVLAKANIFLVVTGINTFPKGNKEIKKQKVSWKEKLAMKLLNRQLKKKSKKNKGKKGDGVATDPVAKGAFIAGISSLGLMLSRRFAGFLSMTHGFALVALIFKLAVLIGLVAIILGIISLIRIKKNPEKYSGKEKAKIGIVLGLIPVLLFVLFQIIVANMSFPALWG